MRLGILSFAAGIWLLQAQAVLPATGACVGLALLAALAISAGHGGGHWSRRVVALLACAALGFAWAGWRAQQRLADSLPEAWETRDVRVSGVVAALPQLFDAGERFVFDVEAVHTAEAQVPGRLLLNWYHARRDPDDPEETAGNRALRAGERWQFTVRLKRPHGNANPFAFDYEAWLFERDIRATGTVRSHAPSERVDAYVVERLRESVRQRFLDVLGSAPFLGVLVALTVGDQYAIPNPQWQVFNRTGVTHLVSI